LGTT